MGRLVTLTPEAMNHHLYGDNSDFMMEYLDYQMDRMSPVAGGTPNRIRQAMERSYEYVSDNLNRYSIHNELSRVGLKELDFYFEDLNSFEELQKANTTMQRWVMAEPRVKKLYLEQNLDGYNGQYNNISGDTYGEDDYDYRRATNGMVLENEEGESYYNQYFEDLMDGDRELDFHEKVAIMNTWDTIRGIMSRSTYDFTLDSEEPQEMNL